MPVRRLAGFSDSHHPSAPIKARLAAWGSIFFSLVSLQNERLESVYERILLPAKNSRILWQPAGYRKFWQNSHEMVGFSSITCQSFRIFGSLRAEICASIFCEMFLFREKTCTFLTIVWFKLVVKCWTHFTVINQSKNLERVRSEL